MWTTFTPHQIDALTKNKGFEVISRIGKTVIPARQNRKLFEDDRAVEKLVELETILQRDPSAVYDLLPRLAELAGRRAGVLSGGEQQMVAFGRAMMARPEALVVDELSLGLAPTVTADRTARYRALGR